MTQTGDFFPTVGVIQHWLQSRQCWMSWATNEGRTLHSPLHDLAGISSSRNCPLDSFNFVVRQ